MKTQINCNVCGTKVVEIDQDTGQVAAFVGGFSQHEDGTCTCRDCENEAKQTN